MYRRLLTSTAAALTAVTLGAAVTSSAGATTPSLTSGAAAYAAAAGTGSATLKANLQLTGSLSQLLDYLISPIVSTDLDPLVSALQGDVSSIANTALGTSSSLNAATYIGEPQYGTAPAAFPNDTLPSPCVSTGAQPCYSGTSTSANGTPLASASVDSASGYVEQVMSTADATNPVFGRSGVTNPQVSVLPGLSPLIPGMPSVGNPLVSATSVAAKANCPNDGAVGATKPATPPSVQESTTGVSLLGGTVTFDVLDGDITDLVVNGVSYADVLSLPDLTVGGVTISSFGTAVLVQIPLTADQVFTALGLSPSVISDLDGYSPTSSVELSLVVGPNAALTNTTATAWGLGVGVDLSGTLGFNLLDLVTADVDIPSGIGGGNYGNILDLRLGYATCQSGVNTAAGSATPAVPAALV